MLFPLVRHFIFSYVEQSDVARILPQEEHGVRVHEFKPKSQKLLYKYSNGVKPT